MNLDDDQTIQVIAENIAWMFSFRKIDIEEIKLTILDVTAIIEIDEKILQKIYQRYIKVIEAHYQDN